LDYARAVVDPQLSGADGAGLPIRQLRLLLVEDDETIAAVLQQMLAEQGHQVAVAGHALQALTLTAGQHYDAVFCDVDLPGLNGLDLARLWRQQGVTTPIIALTARTQADTELQCIEAGMSGFLRKPVTGAQLRQALQAAGLS
jgi:CheY-like chemotaxis protein